MIYDNRQFYIDGAWVDPAEPKEFTVINPATETPAGVISMGSTQDVERAVAAARRAFDGYARTAPAERLALLERVLAAYNAHYDEIAHAISTEMGAPISLAKGSQTRIGVGHISAMIEVLKNFKFEELRGTTRLVQEPVGVCALITPWNWPMNQVAAKVVPALAAGCTMVLKPSEYSPFSAILWAKVMHEAGVPKGVFNLLNGDGPGVGAPLSSHPEIDMVSFTGSTRAGTEVARNAAASVKRVHQELGGKSPNVLLEDADFERAVKRSVLHVFQNSGQSCNAPTRMLVPAAKLAEVEAIAQRITAGVVVGDPASEQTTVGPLVSKTQFDRVERYIEKGIAEGAKLVTGGVAARFFADLKAARAANVSGSPCMKSASFGTTTHVSWHGWTSPDLDCPSENPLLSALIRDVNAIRAASGIGSLPGVHHGAGSGGPIRAEPASASPTASPPKENLS